MKRIVLPPITAAMLLTGTAGLAQSALDQIVDRLRSEKYEEIRVQRTLLGRIRITATGQPGDREIVLNPSTGAILRDYHTERTDNGAPRPSTTTPGATAPASGDKGPSAASPGPSGNGGSSNASGGSSGKSSGKGGSAGNNGSGGKSSGGNASGNSGKSKDKSDRGNGSGKP
ncbi:hypothetical protein [Sagittula stellata]|uniref:hypothetical protein n=1 Tax=Sagittula stellata TaxID=52603 RepID=UPI000308CA1A|nr:hypothetical protein [Sagittula stellata]